MSAVLDQVLMSENFFYSVDAPAKKLGRFFPGQLVLFNPETILVEQLLVVPFRLRAPVLALKHQTRL